MKRSSILRAAVICSTIGRGISANAENLVPNPNFDSTIVPWRNDNPNLTVTWSPLDSNGSATSGSALLVNSYPTDNVALQTYTPCLTLPGATSYDFGGKFRIPSGQVAHGDGFAGISWFSGTDCSALITRTFAPLVTALDSWGLSEISSIAPPTGALSATVTLFAGKTEAGGSFTLNADAAFLSPASFEPCVAGPTTLCIDDQPRDKRFQIEVTFQTAQGGGQAGSGRAIPLSSLGVTQGGLFWFFSADNPELLVKIVNGCSVTQHWWLFASAGTNVGVTITATDTIAGTIETYINPDLTPMAPIQNTNAFACP